MKKLIPLLVLVLASACNGLPQLPNSTTTFSGYYTSAFETSAFLSCDQQAAGLAAAYWLSAEPRANFFEQFSKLGTPTPTGATPAPYTPQSAFVKFEGKLSPPGQYGHLGMYSREITLTKLLAIALPADNQCG